MGELYKRRFMQILQTWWRPQEEEDDKEKYVQSCKQLKKVRDQNGSIVSYTIDYVNLNHNHKLLPS
jgi:hypothetical protein